MNIKFKYKKLISSVYNKTLEIANEKTLRTVQRKRKGVRYRCFIAAFVGEVRLIDNHKLN